MNLGFVRMLRRFGHATRIALAGAAMPAATLWAAPVSFHTFTAESYQPTNTFSPANWIVADLVDGSGDGSVAGELNNSYPTVFYNDADVLGSRIKFLWEPGGDDDLAGFALGYQPGDNIDLNAGYLLFDWKRVAQEFNFADPPEGGIPNFNDATSASNAPASFRASWVQGVPTSDELWGKNDQPENSFGGVTLLAEAANLGQTGYSATGAYVVEVEYGAEQLRVLIDGTEEFNLSPSALPGAPAAFPNGRFGLYEAYQSPGSRYSQADIRPLAETSAADPQPLPAPSLPGGVKAFQLTVTNEDAPSGAAAWSVAASTLGDNQTFVITTPNNGDVDVAYGTTADPADPRVALGLAGAVAPGPADGVMLAVISENGPRPRSAEGAPPIYGTVEAPWDSGFGGVRYGLAIGETLDGSESTANVAAAFFPYADGWIGGVAGPDGTLVSSQGPVSVTQLVAPAPATENGLYEVRVAGASSQQDGLLFTVGGSNENNVTAAARRDDGGWNVAVRDNSAAGRAGLEEFEADDFNFLYLPLATPDLVGGFAAGFDAAGAVELPLAAGDFSLVRENLGQYRLTIPGQPADSGMLLLTTAQPHTLSDGTLAPANFYPTYEGAGDSFLIELRQLVPGGEPTLVDGAFSFAFVSYANPLAVPEPSAVVLASCGLLLSFKRRR